MQSLSDKLRFDVSDVAVKNADASSDACPACQSRKRTGLGAKNEHEVFRCAGCGTLYSTTQSITEADLYDNYYHEGNLSFPTFIHQRVEEIVGRFASYRQNNRLLDLGCGAGVIMQAAAAAGWEVYGLDVSRSAVEHLEHLGYEVFHGELFEARYSSGIFDAVVASELLEHIPGPQTFVREISRILRPAGLFWATTPNGEGLSSRLLGKGWSVVCPPEHLQLFTRTGIKTLLTDAGFARVDIATHGVNPAEIAHRLRRNLSSGNSEETSSTYTGGDRVNSGYRLNAKLSKNAAGRLVKYSVNGLLSFTGLGDSLKIHALNR